MRKTALITGITGQDGSYLAEFLLKKKYKVHGIIRRVALEDRTHRLWRLQKILKQISLHPASLESYASIFNIILLRFSNCGLDNEYILISFKVEFVLSTLHMNAINFTNIAAKTNSKFSFHCDK